MALTKEEQRARRVAKAIRLAYSSLKSHLQYTYGGDMVRNETHLFHQKCIREYAELISLLSKLY